MNKTAAEWVEEGRSLIKEKKLDEALGDFESAISADPNFGEAYFRKAFVFDQMKKDAQTVIDLYLKGIEKGYNGWIPYYNLGAQYNSIGKREEAIAAYDKSLALNEDADCYENKGNSLMALGRIDESIKAFLDSLRVNPENWTVHPRLGGLYDAIGKPEEAMKYFDLCLAANPKHFRANLRKGELLAKSGKHQEALDCFNIIDTNPDPAEAQLSYLLGASCLALGMKEKALEYFNRADKMNPKNSLDYVEKGRCLYMLDRKKEAMEAFRTAQGLLETDNVTMLLPQYIEQIKITLKSMLDVEESAVKLEEAFNKLDLNKQNSIGEGQKEAIKKLHEEKKVAQDKAVGQLVEAQHGQQNNQLSELVRLKEEFNKQIEGI